MGIVFDNVIGWNITCYGLSIGIYDWTALLNYKQKCLGDRIFQIDGNVTHAISF